jgi:hypothetical protein
VIILLHIIALCKVNTKLIVYEEAYARVEKTLSSTSSGRAETGSRSKASNSLAGVKRQNPQGQSIDLTKEERPIRPAKKSRSSPNDNLVGLASSSEQSRKQPRTLHKRSPAAPPSLIDLSKENEYVIDLDNQPAVIDLDAEQELIEDEFDLQEIQRIEFGQQASKSTIPCRNAPLGRGSILVKECTFNMMVLNPGHLVELPNDNFLEIKSIVKNTRSGVITLRGYQLKRTKLIDGLSNKLNELCYCFEIDNDDPRPCKEQSVIEAPLSTIIGTRDMVCTNMPFPMFRFRPEDHIEDPAINPQEHCYKFGKLVVRWKYTIFFENERAREFGSRKNEEKALQHLRAEGCKPENTVPDHLLRWDWRGGSMRGGSYLASKNGDTKGGAKFYDISTKDDTLSRGRTKLAKRLQKRAEAEPIDLLDDTDSESESEFDFLAPALRAGFSQLSMDFESPLSRNIPSVRNPGQMYTFGDGFCGAGGTTTGAVQAGLKVSWGFEHWAHPGETWNQNFPNATLYLMDSDHFLLYTSRLGEDVQVDILHLSPPCQYFSPAHTVDGQHDKMNVRSFLGCSEIVRHVKPRVLTFEETAGLLNPKHLPYLHKLITQMTRLGYSVRWKQCRLSRYG